MKLSSHIQHYLIEGVEEKFNYLKRKFPKKMESDLRELATKIDKKLIQADIKKIKEDEIDSLIEKAKNTKSKTEAKTKGIEGLVEGKDYFSVPTNKEFIKAYVVLNHKASKTIASKKVCNVEGKWCISENHADYWLDHFQGGNVMIMFVTNSETNDEAFAKLAFIFLSKQGISHAYDSFDEEISYESATRYLQNHGIDFGSAWTKFRSKAIQKNIELEDIIHYMAIEDYEDVPEEFKKTIASKIVAPLKSLNNVAFLITVAFDYHLNKQSTKQNLINIELLKKILQYGKPAMPLDRIKDRITSYINHNDEYFTKENIEEAKKLLSLYK